MLSDFTIVIGSKGHDFRKKNRRIGAIAPDGPSPLLARRGGRDIKKNIAKLPLMERTGWWFKIKQKCFLNPNHHPVCGAMVASATFSMPQPPLLARTGDGPVPQVFLLSWTGWWFKHRRSNDAHHIVQQFQQCAVLEIQHPNPLRFQVGVALRVV